MKKFILRILIITLCFSLMPVNYTTVFASEIPLFSEEIYSDDNSITKTEHGFISVVILFVGGIVVGYIVDGIIKYNTGYSAADLTAMQISKIMRIVRGDPDCSSISVNGSNVGCISHTSGSI